MRPGAYGLHLQGLEALDGLLAEAADGWPTAAVTVERGGVEELAEHLDESRGTIVFRDAAALVERDPPGIAFRFAGDPVLDAIVHPYLAPAAGLLSHWRGREALHAGAFVHDGGAWGLVADRGGGKSSTLARLSLDGLPVVADDLLVVDGGRALAGPRAIDLRDGPARELGVGEPLGVLGTRDRWRLRLPAAPSATPLRGWVFLEWGDPAVESVAGGERLERLGAQRMIRRRPTDPTALLRLAALPAVLVRRPRAWSSLEETTRLLLESLPGAPPSG